MKRTKDQQQVKDSFCMYENAPFIDPGFLCAFNVLFMNQVKDSEVTSAQYSTHEVVKPCLQPKMSPEASATMFQNKSEAWLRWVVHEDQRVKREKSLFWALCRDAAWPIEVKGMNETIHWV